MRKVRGSVFGRGHQGFTRGILKDADVTVESVGTSFYNANDFTLVMFLGCFVEYCKTYQPQTMGKREIAEIWKTSKSRLKAINKIVIASTPEWVEKSYMDQLDGGILHEAFHSLYTKRGTDFDAKRMLAIMEAHFDPSIDYGARGDLLRILNNIYEDAFIERMGQVDFKGALYKIQTVHQLVWDMEKEGRQNRPVGAPFENKKGMMSTGFNPMAHLTCYLRDRVEHYLKDAPLEEYDEDVRYVVDTFMGEVIADSDKTENSYDVFELAMRTLKIIAELQDMVEEEGGDGESEEDSEDQGDCQEPSDSSKSDGKGKPDKDNKDSKDKSESNEEGSASSGDGDSEEEKDSNDSDNGEGGDNDKDSGSDKEDEDEGEDSDEENEGDDSDSEKDSDSDTEEDPEEDSDNGEQENKPAQPSPEDLKGLAKALSDLLNDPEGMEDLASSLKQVWDDQLTSGAPQSIFPFSRDYDETSFIESTGTDYELRQYNEIVDKVKKDTLYIRPRLLSFFRGKSMSRVKHKQEKGRRLSSRSISEVVYKEKPRPFQQKEVTNRQNACVSLILDESGSMGGQQLSVARQVLVTLALTIGGLKIPMEVLGFTTNNEDALDNYLRENDVDDYSEYVEDVHNKFTRTCGLRHRIFRTFDEPFNVNSYRKMVHTEAYGLTPLPDSIDFAAKRMLERNEDRKVLFVVTDGYPYYGNTRWSHEDYLKIMENQVQEFKREGIEIMFIGMGHDAEFVKRFPNSVNIKSLNSFAPDMAAFLFEQMKRILANR